MHKKGSPPRIYSKSWQCNERTANEPIQILTEHEAEVYHMKNSFSVVVMGLVAYNNLSPPSHSLSNSPFSTQPTAKNPKKQKTKNKYRHKNI